MPAHTHLQRRKGGVYYLRRRVPGVLVQAIGKPEVVRSLRTTDLEKAKRRVRRGADAVDDLFDAVLERAQQADGDVTGLRDVAAEYLDRAFAEERLEAREHDPGGRLRAALDRIRRVGVPLDDISQETAEYLARVYGKRWLDMVVDAEAAPTRPTTFERQEANAFAMWSEEMDLREAAALGKIQLVSKAVEQINEQCGLKLERGSTGHKRLSKAVLRALADSLKVQQAVVLSDPVPEYHVPPRPPGAPHMGPEGHPGGAAGYPGAAVNPRGLTLSEAFAGWKREAEIARAGKLRTQTAEEWERACRLFRELHGDLPMVDITRTHAAAFQQALMKRPKGLSKAEARLPLRTLLERIGDDDARPKTAAATVNKNLTALSSVWEWASRRDDELSGKGNPFAKLQISRAKNAEERRQPYEAEDLNAIFRGPVYTRGERPRAGAGEAAYWLPLMALFTGARLEELGKLLVSEVVEEDGQLVLNITRQVKTATSRRKIPVHPELLRLGFRSYVEERRRRTPAERWGEAQLFPDLEPDAHDKITGAWSKWWGRYARKRLGISDKRLTFHSFRHAFKDACRRARIPEENHDALTGHGPASRVVSRGYGAGMATLVQILAHDIATISYPGLDLSAVPVWRTADAGVSDL